MAIEKKFESSGYIIVNDTTGLVKFLRSEIVNEIKKINLKLKNFTEEQVLNNFHKYFSKKNVNGVRLNLYNSINKIQNIDKIYYSICKETLDNLVGNEVAMQKKINLSIQMPKDSDSLLDMHSDIYAGESPFQVVVWIPLVDVSSTKSMFITSPKYNKKLNSLVLKTNNLTTRDIYKKNKKFFHFLNIKFGQILIFSPLILHGNTINNSSQTRFSLNSRFKSLLSPYDVKVKSHRNIPQFYKPLNTKIMTKIGFKYLMKYEEN
jgi:sporadic carbohydrate cluster 2OG-Fe(II) oxygenase